MTPRIDPRFRARRVAVRRAEGRRRLRFVTGAAVVVALAVAGWGLTRSPVLDLDHVRIEGVEGSELATVQSVVDLEPGTPLFDLDLGHVEDAIAAVPWVAGATATREWPGTVRVTVARRTPVAVVGTGDELVFVDGDGVLMGPAPTTTGLPRIALAPTASFGDIEPSVIGGLAVAGAIPDDLAPWVDAVTVADESGVDGRAHVGLSLIGSARVELGVVELIDDKLAALRAVLDGADLRCVSVIDVATADLTTISRDAACDGAAEPAAVAPEQ